jgi:hypothetical protein
MGLASSGLHWFIKLYCDHSLTDLVHEPFAPLVLTDKVHLVGVAIEMLDAAMFQFALLNNENENKRKGQLHHTTCVV